MDPVSGPFLYSLSPWLKEGPCSCRSFLSSNGPPRFLGLTTGLKGGGGSPPQLSPLCIGLFFFVVVVMFCFSHWSRYACPFPPTPWLSFCFWDPSFPSSTWTLALFLGFLHEIDHNLCTLHEMHRLQQQHNNPILPPKGEGK